MDTFVHDLRDDTRVCHCSNVMVKVGPALWECVHCGDTLTEPSIDDTPRYRCLGCDRPLTPEEIFSVSIHSRAGWCNGCVSVALLEAACQPADESED